jgi:hypothetical protein
MPSVIDGIPRLLPGSERKLASRKTPQKAIGHFGYSHQFSDPRKPQLNDLQATSPSRISLK